jgi:23S rRNA (pseudouridine1915-N3)-methyltransferase
MKIIVAVTGKTDSEWLNKGIETYFKRLIHYTSLEIKVFPDLKNRRNMPADLQKEKEALQMIPFLEGKNDIFLLDESGQHFTSREFASFLNNKLISASRELIFVIGGPFGFSEKLYSLAAGKISLSRMTLSHQMVRLLFAEQLYRAFTIIRGEAYHND